MAKFQERLGDRKIAITDCYEEFSESGSIHVCSGDPANELSPAVGCEMIVTACADHQFLAVAVDDLDAYRSRYADTDTRDRDSRSFCDPHNLGACCGWRTEEELVILTS